MLAKERQEYIRRQIQSHGAVTVAELTEQLNVSIETVRRDLLALEQIGHLQRVHGGAVAPAGMKPFFPLSHRIRENEEAKRELSATAVRQVRNGDVIGIDTGSTPILFAEALKKELSSLTVVTYSLDVFESLYRFKDFQVILCGGHFLPEENTFYGELTLDSLKKLHMQKVFLFPSAVSLQHGIGDYQKDIYALQKQMLRSSDEAFILADSSKFERTALLKLDEMNPRYTYVTDSGLREELRELYRQNQIEILIEG